MVLSRAEYLLQKKGTSMLFNKSTLAAALLGAGSIVTNAYAQCVSDGDVRKHQSLYAQEQRVLQKLVDLGDDCSPQGFALGQERMSLLKQMIAITGKYSCAQARGPHQVNVQAIKNIEDIFKNCRLEQAASQSATAPQQNSGASSPPPQAQRQAAPQSGSGASRPPQVQQQPPAQQGYRAPSTARPSQGADPCSTITSASNPSGGATCPPHKPRLACAGGTSFNDCLNKAGWTAKEPYNHSNQPIYFRWFNGPQIAIGKGQSLWNVPTSSGRKLEPRAWNYNGDERVGTDPAETDPTKCTDKDIGANRREFQVSIVCEMNRQQKLQNEYERREDSYMDPTRCKKEQLVYTQNWNKKDPKFWMDNPGTPVAYCVMSDGTKRPTREPGWLTKEECETLPSQKGIPIYHNTRGILGCRQVNY